MKQESACAPEKPFLNCQRLSFNDIPNQSPLFLDFQKNTPKLDRFYPEKQTALKDFSEKVLTNYQVDRAELVDILTETNKFFGAGAKTLENIEQLREKDCVVIVTGQQAGLFSGALYTIYKALSFIQDRTNSDTIYLATNVGLFNSSDRGNSWTHLTVPKPPEPKKEITRRSSKRRSTKSKTTKAKPKPAPPVVPVTTDLASTAPLLIPALEEKVKVLAHTEDDKNGILAGTDKGLYRSYDIKKGWERVSLGAGIDENIFVIYTSPLQPGTIWVGTAVSGVIISRDDGETWQKVVGIPENLPISSMAIDPKRPQNVYIGTSQTFYLSRDGGRFWTRRGGNLPLGNYASIIINPNNSDEIYTASSLESDGGIFFSNDAGMKWTRIDTKELKLPSHRVWAMTFDPNDSNRIFAGTHSSGVYLIERAVKSRAADNKTPPRVSTTGN